MAFEIKWSKRAEENLEQIFRFIQKHDSEFSAEKFIKKIFQNADKLTKRPTWIGVNLRNIQGHSHDDLRYIMVSSYKIIYDVIGDTVEILAVVHKSRLLADLIDPPNV
jgi:toxin ParE1/3/4